MGLDFEEIDPKNWRCIKVVPEDFDSIRDAFMASTETIIEEIECGEMISTGQEKSESLDRNSFENGFKEGFSFCLFAFSTGKIRSGDENDYKTYGGLNDE